LQYFTNALIFPQTVSKQKYFRRKYELGQQRGNKKMMKSARKKPGMATSARKTPKGEKSRTKAGEYVGYLLELHKLQGVLLTELHKKV